MPLKDKASLKQELGAVRADIAAARARMDSLRDAYQEYNVLAARVMRLRDKENDIDTQLAEMDGRFVRVPFGASGLDTKTKGKDKVEMVHNLLKSMDPDTKKALMAMLKG